MKELIKRCVGAILVILALVIFVWPTVVSGILDWAASQISGRNARTESRVAYWDRFEKE